MSIERRSHVSITEFHKYRAVSKPVLLHGAMEEWSAMGLWTDEYLARTCGEETVQVMAWRDADSLYEIRSDQHRSSMRFADYISTIKNIEGESNNFYIVANNGFLRRPGTQVLLKDIAPFRYTADYRSGDNTFFWFGAAGTLTPLHYDTCDLFLCQIRGRKRITMLAPNQTPLLYNNIGVFSDVDCADPDLVLHPLYKRAKKHTVYLEPWEALFIPQGWWHHVRALDVSISVSFTQLLSSNERNLP